MPHDAARVEPKPVAAVITAWRRNSHADVLLARLLEPAAWGHRKPFGLKLVAVYADQFPADDLCRRYCERHGVPVFPTVRGAVGVGGTRGVPVEGVLVIGEHGTYPRNARGQQLYPRRRLFEEVVDAFRSLGRRVPIFNDKHLSYDWLSARRMYDLARSEGFPLMAGSSVPVAWRLPAITPAVSGPASEALGVGYSDRDAYGFHALEGFQCVAERRPGAERGVASVRCLSGRAVAEAFGRGDPSPTLLDALDAVRRQAAPGAAVRPARPGPRDDLFLIRYADGFKGAVAMLDSVGECFAMIARRDAAAEPEAVIFALESQHPFGHFGHLLRAVEYMVHTGRAAYPVERTLLTTGVLEALLQSRAQGGIEVPTPHLCEGVAYSAPDWSFAPGPPGTPA